MELRVLGPVEASADSESLALGGTKQRAVLAMLALDANRTVPADHLIEGLWGEDPPVSAAKMVQNYVWRLRTVLGERTGAEILTRGRGYELRVDPDSVDVRRFQRLLAEANRAGAGGEPADAAREALALWRGPALADVVDAPFAAPEIRRLEELRVEAVELALDADLAAGHHLEVAGEIDAIVAEHPLRERLHAQRMLALYRCGRQAEALDAYREARSTLVDEVGVEPGPELRRLHEAILRQDPALDVEVAVRELPRELDAAAAPPLAGRDDELAWLRAQWQRARAGEGALVALLGPPGIGKTRLAAELAGVVHGEGATVVYAAGARAPDVALASIARTRRVPRPVLLVLDDADRAGAAVRAAVAEPSGEACLVLVTGRAAADLAASATCSLAPLDAAGVRRIALRYGDEPPVDALLSASDGVPERVHELASAWARREAARRVDAVADRAAAGREQARALESELAGSVAALQSTHERADVLAAAHHGSAMICPFKGLATFDVDDADYFFGREQLVAQLVARLVGAPLLAIVGPSGSGKSSALRAGLLPALATGVLPGSDGWARALFRPGAHPARELRRVTDGLPRDRRAVLAVDQFEEIFTACRDAQEREAFVDDLVREAHDPDGHTVVVLALRADFYTRCAEFPELARLVGANHVLVGPMARDELRRAITRPAARVGLRVEPELEDALVEDVAGQPGALPLLSTALLELWRQRRGRELQLAAYRRAGGVEGAVARLAEDAFGRLEPPEREVARALLLRLADEGEDGTIVRRRVPLDELEPERSERFARVLDVLAERRLLTVSAGTVEVAHEALLREWPRLRGWLEEDAEGRRLQRQLAQAARDWDAGGRDPGELYRGGRLASALEWRGAHETELNAAEHAFLDAGKTASERARRRLRLVLAGMLALVVLASGAALAALEGQDRAQEQAQAAEAQRLGADAASESALDRSLLLARQGVALDDTPATRDNLLAALRRSPAAVGVMRGDGDILSAIDVDPAGRTIAVGDSNGTVMFLDARTRRRLAKPHQSGGVSRVVSLAFSPDGRRVATTGWDQRGGFADLFEGRTGRHIARLDPQDPLNDIGAKVSFSPDSRVLALQTQSEPAWPNRLLRWDARTGRPLVHVQDIPGRKSVLLGYIGSRPITSSTKDGTTVMRDAATLDGIRRYPVADSVAATSPARGLIAFGSREGTVRLLDTRTGAIDEARTRHDGAVTSMRFSSNGRRLLTAGNDERLIVWDTRRFTPIEALPARGRGRLMDVAITRDGRTAYTAGRDGTMVAWDLDGARRLERPLESVGAARAFAATGLGSPIATTDAGGFVELVDGRTVRPSGRVRVAREAPMGLAVSPDGRSLASTTAPGGLSFWDVRAGRRLGGVQTVHAAAWTLAFSGDGRWLAVGGAGSIAQLWDARRPRLAGSIERSVFDLSLSKDGATLAATVRGDTFGGGLELYSVPDLERIRSVRMPAGELGRFTQNGRSFVYGDLQGRVWILDTRTWKPRGRPLRVQGSVIAADLSADGRWLATTYGDGTARLWDAASGRPVGAPLTSASGNILSTAFVRGGSELAVVTERGGYVWDVRPESWERRACAVAGRRLTRAEWEAALPGRDYAPAC